MAIINLKKGLDLHLKGGIAGNSLTAKQETVCAVIPDDFYGVVPKLAVKQSDVVKSGDILYHDRQYPEICVTSPTAGTVKEIRRGERRKIQAIIIESETSQTAASIDTTDVKSALLNSGLWACMRQRPYDIVPSPTVAPRDIFVTAFDSSPLAPDFNLYIKGKESYIQKGINALASLTEGKVYIGTNSNDTSFDNAEVNIFNGPHPAGNISVQIANVKAVNKGEVVWTLDIVTLARIGEMLTTGHVPFDTIVAVTGSEVKRPQYVTTTMGARVATLLDGNLAGDASNLRIISGNVLTGRHTDLDSYIQFPYRQITVIPENNQPDEFMGWASLSPKKFSIYHSFLSWLFKNREVTLDSRLKGGERAIVMAGEYDKMLPMDIYAEFLIKAIIAFDIDKMEQLGIYEIAPEDFALCEFADTSKIELQKIIREGLDRLNKEMN